MGATATGGGGGGGATPNKKIPVLRVTQLCLNFLAKPRIFFRSENNIILCILKGEMPFKMHKIIFFFQIKKIVKKLCVPTLPKIFKPFTRNTLIFLIGLRYVLLAEIFALDSAVVKTHNCSSHMEAS